MSRATNKRIYTMGAMVGCAVFFVVLVIVTAIYEGIVLK